MSNFYQYIFFLNLIIVYLHSKWSDTTSKRPKHVKKEFQKWWSTLFERINKIY